VGSVKPLPAAPCLALCVVKLRVSGKAQSFDSGLCNGLAAV